MLRLHPAAARYPRSMRVLIRVAPYALFLIGFAFAKAAKLAFGTARAGQGLIFAFTVLGGYFSPVFAAMLVDYRRARRGQRSFVSSL